MAQENNILHLVDSGSLPRAFAITLMFASASLAALIAFGLSELVEDRGGGGEYAVVDQKLGGLVALAAIVFAGFCCFPFYKLLVRRPPTYLRFGATGLLLGTFFSLTFGLMSAVEVENARLDHRSQSIIAPIIGQRYVPAMRGSGYWLIDVINKNAGGLDSAFIWTGHGNPDVQAGECLQAQEGPGRFGLEWNGSESVVPCPPDER